MPVLHATVKNLRQSLRACQQHLSLPVESPFSKYKYDPSGYASDVLNIKLTADQEEMLLAMVKPPYRVFARAGHAVGKSLGAAVAISWLYDTRDPAMILSTAPRRESVKNIIWRELHIMRERAGLPGFKTSASLEMRSSPSHFALGMTARNTYGFQGKHELNCFIIIDEATGVEPEFFEAADSMLNGEEYGLLAIYNPLSTATKAYEEEQKGAARNTVIALSCLNHPNIEHELLGKPAPYPSAVRLEWVNNAVKEWSDVIPEEDVDAAKGDFIWPPKSLRVLSKAVEAGTYETREVDADPEVLRKTPPTWYRPGPLCKIRVKGEWPSEGIDTVWSEELFNRCRANRLEVEPHWKTAIGCDVARFGDDLTVMVVRRGACVVHVEEHGGWDTSKTVARLKSLAFEYRGPEDERRVRVFIDEPGMGAGVIDHGGGYNFIGVNPASKSATGAAQNTMLSVGRTTTEFVYVNMRAQLWFDARNIARKDGLMDLSRLSKDQAVELKRQLMAQTYDFRPTDGAVFLHSKDDIKEKLKRSPDTADALNLCFCRLSPIKDTLSVMR